jgi:hypothetical protein
MVLLATVALIFSTGCEGSGPFADPLYVTPGDNPYDTPERFITAIHVQPAGVNIAIGGGQMFKALAIFNDATSQYITTQVEWYAENPGVGIFEQSTGIFFPQHTGVAVVRCRIPQGGTTLVSTAAFVNAFNPNADLPPAVPTNPDAMVTDEGVRVTWDMNITDGDMAGYNIYRTQTYGAHYASDFGRVNFKPMLYPPFLDSTVVSGWYYYRVTAEDLLGIQSAPSEEVSVFVTYSTHYGGSYDAGSMSADEHNYKDSFTTVY